MSICIRWANTIGKGANPQVMSSGKRDTKRVGGKISTGLEAIDRQLSGGLEPGSLLSVVAKPTMQSEALLHKTVEKRPTLYLTALREVEAVESALPDVLTDNVFVKSVCQEQSMDNDFLREVTGNGSYTPTMGGSDTLVDSVYELISNIDRDINVVIDPTNPLEETENKDAYREVLNKLKSTMLDNGGLGILHCIDHEGPPEFRDVTLTISDVVWELDLKSNMDELRYELIIPKNRGGPPVLDKTTLMMDADIWIDESRRI